MEPLSPNDPLHTLLGKARPVEPRPNFTQNVLRAIRQTPQSLSAWERVQAWFDGLARPRMVLAGAAAAVAVAALVIGSMQTPASQAPVMAQQPAASVVQTQPQLAQPPIYHVSAAMILAATAETTPAPAPAPVVEQEDRDPMELLLVQQDTSALTDSELALLVY